MSVGLDWLREMNNESLSNAEDENTKRREMANDIDFQCQKDTVDGNICRFIKKYAESQDPPLQAKFEWNGVVSWFTVGETSVSLMAGRFLDGSGKLTIQKSELEENKWWHDALYNNPEMDLPIESLDIQDEAGEKKKTEEIAQNEESVATEVAKEKVSLLQELLAEGSPENERKFLVKYLPPDLEEYPSSDIIQGYFDIQEDGTEFRVRRDGDDFFKTIKSDGDQIRTEQEKSITEDEYNNLWKGVGDKIIEKKRYRIPHEGRTIELDIYKEGLNSLIVAEVEFKPEEVSNQFIPPKWFGEEVTENKSYKNKNLAVHGIPVE